MVNPLAHRTSRGKLLGASAVGLLLAGCGSSAAPRQSSDQSSPPAIGADVGVLNSALAIELHSAAAYTAAIPLLSGRTQKDAKQFLSQDLSHASRLSGIIKQAGGEAVEPLGSYNLGSPRNESELLMLLHSVEGTVVAGYLQAIPRLSDGIVRAVVASILANDAQHMSVLRTRLRLPPVPSALVSGRE